MIDFDPTPDQEDLRILAHEFARDVIRPAAAEYDEREETPWSMMHEAHESGFDTYAYPEEFGGGGVTDTDDGHASTATSHLPQQFTQFSEKLSNPVNVARRSPVSRTCHDPGFRLVAQPFRLRAANRAWRKRLPSPRTNWHMLSVGLQG
jgi:hypothetical protein